MVAMTGSLEDLAKELGEKVVNQVITDFGDGWSSVKSDVKDVLTAVAKDAGKVAVMNMAGIDTSEEEKHIHAQLLNLKVAGELAAANAFWESFSKVMQIIGRAVGTIAASGLKALAGGLV